MQFDDIYNLLIGTGSNDAILNSYTELLVRFGIDILAILLLVRYIYYPNHRNKEYFFTFFLFNAVNLLICYVMSGTQLGAGFGFGLFAVFSILRYRTITVPIREMGYFFAGIAIALINGLMPLKNGLLLIILINTLIVGLIYILERFSVLSHANFKPINYERIDLIHPDRREEMIADLTSRTGLPIYKVEIIKIDFLRDTARIHAFYLSENNDMSSVGDSNGDDD